MIDVVKFNEVKNVTTEKYFENNEFAVDIFLNKYSHTKEDGNKETPAEVFWRISSILSEFEENKEHYRDIWFTLMYDDWFRPGGSILSGVGSGKKVSTGNCTTIPIEGDTLEDISKAEYTLWKCAAYRQGMGIEMSPLRPRDSLLGNAAEKSTGVIPWCKKFDSVGDYVGQQGRRPAILISLLVNHPDILEFITSKKERGNIENANISVQITNDFMDCLENGKMWKLHFETERETIEKEIDPNEIIDLISETAVQSGEPGIQYRDLLRKCSMTHVIYKATGDERFKLVSSNACVTGDQTLDVIVNGKHQIMTIEDVLHLFEEQSDILILSSNKDGVREYKPLKNVFLSRKNVELLKITDEETGKSIKCTPDHEIYTKNRGYVQAQDLKMDDELEIL